MLCACVCVCMGVCVAKQVINGQRNKLKQQHQQEDSKEAFSNLCKIKNITKVVNLRVHVRGMYLLLLLACAPAPLSSCRPSCPYPWHYMRQQTATERNNMPNIHCEFPSSRIFGGRLSQKKNTMRKSIKKKRKKNKAMTSASNWTFSSWESHSSSSKYVPLKLKIYYVWLKDLPLKLQLFMAHILSAIWQSNNPSTQQLS